MTEQNYEIAQNEAQTQAGWNEATAYVQKLRQPEAYANFLNESKAFLAQEAQNFDRLVELRRAHDIRRWYKQLKAFDPTLASKLLPFRTAVGLLRPEIYQENIATPLYQLIVASNLYQEQKKAKGKIKGTFVTNPGIKPTAALRTFYCMGVVQAIFWHIEEAHLQPEDYNFEYLLQKELSVEEFAWLQRGPLAYLSLLTDDEGKTWQENLLDVDHSIIHLDESQIQRSQLNFDVRTRNLIIFREEYESARKAH